MSHGNREKPKRRSVRKTLAPSQSSVKHDGISSLNAIKLNLDRQEFGSSKDNYLLFDGLTMSRLTRTLQDAFVHLGLKPKTYHCCRHSLARYLVGETRSFFLGKAMLGHKSDVHEDYIHIFEIIKLKAKVVARDRRDCLDAL